MHWTLILVLCWQLPGRQPAVLRYPDFPTRAACLAKGRSFEKTATEQGLKYGAWSCQMQDLLHVTPSEAGAHG